MILRRTRTSLAFVPAFLLTLSLVIAAASASAFDVWAFIEVGGQAVPGVSDPIAEKDGGIPLKSFMNLSSRRFSGGLPAGNIELGPIRFAKALDAASPLLLQAAANNSPITTATFKFFRPNENTGITEWYYSVTVTNGQVEKINQAGGVSLELESIQLQFQAIQQEYVPTGVSSSASN